MQKKSLFKGLLTTAFAAAMAVMVAVPAKAAPAAPALSLKNTITDDQHVTGYTFSTSQVSNGSTIYFNVYKTDPKASLTGSYSSGTITSKQSYAVYYPEYYNYSTDTHYYYDDDNYFSEEVRYYYTENGEKKYTTDLSGAQPIVNYYDSDLNRSYSYDVVSKMYYYWGYDENDIYGKQYVSTPTGTPQYRTKNIAKSIAPIEYNYFYSDRDDCSLSKGSEFTLDVSKYAPGTYYVTATLYDGVGYNRDYNAYQAYMKSDNKVPGEIKYCPDCKEYYSGESAPVAITVTGGASISTAVTSTSVQLDLTGIGKASGYEIYRKAGKKFVKIATTSKATYTDKGLTSKTKYTYKVRPYYYDTVTKAKTMGAYTQVSTTTNGSALNLKAQVKGKKNVVLNWTKVKGATKYEIYRSAVSSSATMTKKGQTNAYYGEELIATVKKSKKKYVDKKATSGESYVYTVRAVVANSDKKSSKKKLDVEDAKSVSLKFGKVDTISLGDEIVKADGSKTIQWAKVSGATGYVVEKLDPSTDSWTVVQNLGKNATKTILPAAVAEKYVTSTSYNNANKEYNNYAWKLSDTYRICAVKGNTRSEAEEVTVKARLAAVNSVTATKVANGIQVTWDAVPGATYYKVYRVMAGALYSNKDAGYNTLKGSDRELVYSYSDLSTLTPFTNIDGYNKENGASLDNKKTYYYANYSYKTDEITTTSVLDYAGYVVGGSAWSTTNDKDEIVYKSSPVEVANIEAYHVGPQDGVSYQYYVEAYMASAYTADSYFEQNPNADKNNAEDVAAASAAVESRKKEIVPVPNTLGGKEITITEAPYDDVYDVMYDNNNKPYPRYVTSVGVKKVNTVTYSDTTAPSGKAKLKAVKSPKKKTVSISFKKVAGATSYNIYRSTKKKGKYTCVANVTKTKYKDKTVKSGKKYYYKVVAVNANEAGADVEGKASKPKAVKAK